MKLTARTARWAIAAGGVACAAILLPAVALAAPAAPSRPAAPAAASRCTASDLIAWIGVPGDGSAGAVGYQLELSNASSHACTLYGYPGVSAAGPGGSQLGSAAVRNSSNPVRLVTLHSGGTAHIELGITDVGVYSRSACHQATAATLRVYAPGDFGAKVVPFSFTACRKAGPKYLHVSAVISGTGVPFLSS
jgi:hypothetical protein